MKVAICILMYIMSNAMLLMTEKINEYIKNGNPWELWHIARRKREPVRKLKQ